MPEQIKERAQRAIEEKTVPGCVVGIIRANERAVLPFGTVTYDEQSPEVREDTIYDLASVTKSIPIASLAAMFVAQGKLKLEDKVVHYIPELQNDFGATIEDLLRYRVRGPRMSTLNFTTFEQVRTHIHESGFDGPPGEPEYSNIPAFLLGMVLERVGGMILPALAHKYFFGPLEMKDTTFFPRDIERTAPTEIAYGNDIRGIVHDESARLFATKRRAVGHAGLFSTTPDLLNFIEAVLRGAFPTIVAFAQDRLGWQREGDLLGSHPNKGMFGKTGFTGTSLAIDPARGIGLVLLSNRTYPHRPADSSAINSLRKDIADIVFTS